MPRDGAIIFSDLIGKLDQDILPLDKAHLTQTTAKLICKFLVVISYRGVEAHALRAAK